MITLKNYFHFNAKGEKIMFKGIFTPIITPFKENEDIDFESLKFNLVKWSKTKLDGIVVLGSNGEFAYLNDTEKKSIVDFVKNNFTHDKKIIVGTYHESTNATIKFSNEVADLGADAVLVLPPNYYKGAMKEEVIYNHFIKIAEESKVPVMIYNMPGNTGINMSADLVARLSRHDNIVGIKDTSGNIVQLTQLICNSDKDFTAFAGNAGYLLPALAVGAKGATLALANCLPDECCELVECFNQGDLDKARHIQYNLLNINMLVTGKYGIPGLKAAMELMGFRGGYPRLPFKPANEQVKEEIRTELLRISAL